MAYIWIFVGIAAGFFVLQSLLSNKIRNPVVKSIPAGLLILGLLFCLILYIGIGGPASASVIAENQSFAKFLSIHVAAALAGCAAGAVFAKIKHPGQ